jgi:excisionase family DNA binding protein
VAEPEIMTIGEVAAYLRVHPSTIYRLLKHQEIPGFKIGSDWRFTKTAIDHWVTERGKLDARGERVPMPWHKSQRTS